MSSARSLHWGKDESKEAGAEEGTDAEEGDDHPLPAHPPQMSKLSSIRHSVLESVQSVIHEIEDRLHRMYVCSVWTGEVAVRLTGLA